MRLAFAIVSSCYDQKKAQKAEEAFVSTFQKKENTEITLSFPIENQSLENIALINKLVDSKSKLRQLIDAGAVTDFDSGKKITHEQAKQIAAPGTYKIGKSRIFKLVK